MLYEGLTGHQPPGLSGRRSAEADANSTFRLSQQAPRLLKPFADLVDRMLATRPEDRPSTSEALVLARRILREEQLQLPRLGSTALLDQVLDRLQDGESVAIWGAPGVGKTRMLLEADRCLQTMGRSCRFLIPSDRPFGSLQNILPELEVESGKAATSRVHAFLQSSSLTLFADDFPSVDHWTREMLSAHPPPGGLLYVANVPDAQIIEPLQWMDLKPLFVGPDRIVHLQEDAARQVHRRTDGVPKLIERLLRTFLHEGLVQRDEDRFSVDRSTLSQLATEVVVHGIGQLDLDQGQEELVGWIQFGGLTSTLEMLTRVLARPRWSLELELERLAEIGAIRREEDGTLRPLVEVRRRWSARRRARAHRAFAQALPAGTEGRLWHLVAAGVEKGLVSEALLEAAQYEQKGHLEDAVEVLQTGLNIVGGDTRLSSALIRVLLAQDTDGAMAFAHNVALAAGTPDMVRLIDGVRLARQGKGEAARELLTSLPPFGDQGLEMRRLAALAAAAKSLPLDAAEELLNTLRASPVIEGSEENRAHWQGWLGLLRFRQRRFTEAATIQEDAAERRATLAGKLGYLLNASKAWLEANHLRRAEQIARQVAKLAEGCRHIANEGDAAWVLRSIYNRRGGKKPDLEFVDCIEKTGSISILARAAITEAFIAWRGEHSATVTLAERARVAFVEMGNGTGALHAEALAWSMTKDGDPNELVMRTLEICPPPDILWDILGLIAWGGAYLKPFEEVLQKVPLPERKKIYTGAMNFEDACGLLAGCGVKLRFSS